MAEDKNQGLSSEQIALIKTAREYSEQFNLSLTQSTEILTRIQNGQIKVNNELEDAIVRADEYTREQKAIIGLQQDQNKVQKEIRDISKAIVDETKKITDNNVNIYTVTQDQAESQLLLIKSRKNEIKELLTIQNLSNQQKEALAQGLEQLDAQAGVYEDINELYEKHPDIAEKMKSSYGAASEGVTKLGTGIDKLFGKLPGGGVLQSALGLDEATDKLQGGVNVGFQAMNESIAKGGKGMGPLKAGMSAFNSVVMMNPLLLVVAAGTALFGLLSEVEKTAQEFTAETGLSVAQSKALVKETRTRLNLGQTELVNSEEILDVQKAMIKEFGTAGQLSTEVAASVAETAKMMGYSAEAAAGVQSAFERQGASAADAAKLQETVALETFKAGVSTGAVMEDISQNSDKAAKYIKGGAKELAKAAVEAAKMGMSLESMVNVADGLLDIENSLTKQYEFQALTGKQLNLDKARELALDGDIAGASKEVMKQVGSIADFNKMNRLEKEALAEATGMEVSELQKSLTLQSKLGDLSEEQAAAAASLNLSAEEMAKMSPEQLKSKIKEQQSAEKAKIAFEETIQKLKSAFLPLAETLGKVLGAIMPVVSFIGDGFSAIGKLLGLVLWPVEKVFSGLTSIMDMMGPLGTLIKGVGVALLLWWVYKKWIAKQNAKATEEALKQKDIETQRNVNQMQLQKLLAEQQSQQQNISQQVQESLTGEKERIQLIEEENKALKDQGAIQQENAQVSGPTDAVPGGGPAGGKGLLGKAKGLFGGAGAKIMGAATGFMNSDIGGMVKEKAIEAMMGGVMGVGDLAIDPNGGPVVASPREGGIYQGTKNDGVSMSPGHGGAAGGGAPAIDYNALGAAVAAAIAANPPQINLDGSKVSQSVTATQSRNRGL
jgi:hypothetical protein